MAIIQLGEAFNNFCAGRLITDFKLGTARPCEIPISEVSSRTCRSKEELAESFLPSTLAWRQIPDLAGRLDRLLTQLLDTGMLTQDERGGLHGTPLGRAVVRHQIGPESAVWLLGLVDHPPIEDGPTDFDLLLYHCWDSGLQPTLSVSIETVGALEDLVSDIPGRTANQGLRQWGADGYGRVVHDSR